MLLYNICFTICQALFLFVTLVLSSKSIHRLYAIDKSITMTNSMCLEISNVIESKVDKMVLTDQQIEDLNIICHKL